MVIKRGGRANLKVADSRSTTGIPGAAQRGEQKKRADAVIARLTDQKKYTGQHRKLHNSHDKPRKKKKKKKKRVPKGASARIEQLAQSPSNRSQHLHSPTQGYTRSATGLLVTRCGLCPVLRR
jgi:hypothetical protein